MAKQRKHIVLRIIVFTVLLIIAGAGCWTVWFTHHYKEILKERIPLIVASGSDSLYHISLTDINISLLNHNVTISGIQLTPDTMRAQMMRLNRQRIPTTLSTVSIPLLEINGIVWGDITDKHSFDCTTAIAHGLKWKLAAHPHPEDSLFPHKDKKKPFLERIAAAHFTILEPDITYHYTGSKESFTCHMKGGTANLDQFAYNFDVKKDTSVFLYAKAGVVRFNEFMLLKPSGKYLVRKPLIDFSSTEHMVTLKGVKLNHLENRDPQSNVLKEIYDLSFPAIELQDFNWNSLITNTLAASLVKAKTPDISIRYVRAAQTSSNKMGSYPHQLLLQVGIQTCLKQIDIENGHFRYVEVTEKNQEGKIEFSGIKARFSNVTNMDSVIALHKECEIKLQGRFMKKSPVDVTFKLWLADKTGRFTMDGTVKDIDGDEVLDQTRAFTVVEVTSFHLTEMDIHEQGDESYVKGAFAVRYEDLKISLLKFKSKHRKGKKGPLSFLGSSLLLFPSNPMPDKDVRKVTTTFARDPNKGFINMVWKNMYRAAKKTAVRDERLIDLTDGKETTKGEDPKKPSFFKRLFGKKKKD